MPGQLFTQYFLSAGIRATPEWRESVERPEPFAVFARAVVDRFSAFGGYADPNEAVTEQELIRPLLELLGWSDYLPQQGAARNEDIPDHLLFAGAEDKTRAAARGHSQERYRDALLIEESKRFGLPLDNRDPDDTVQRSTPHGQILRYLATAETVSDGHLRWGILSNGGVWRLYDYRARPRASGYFEADLAAILPSNDSDALRTFYLLFRRASFVPRQGGTFIETALAEGRRYEEQVAQDLSSVVFERVFPKLVEALAGAEGADLAEARQAALIFLYRLLFLLYAEDRGLLPVDDSRYDDYGLRKRVRDDIAGRMDQGDTFSTTASHYGDHLTTLCRLIDRGDASIGLPPYNGGLFAPQAAPLLDRVRLPDAVVAPIVYDLSHAQTREGRRFVNYRDMSVQQLGSIYERLLEREPVRDGAGAITVRPNPYARKDSGSFYTPQELVDLIVERTLKPLAEERLRAFEEKAKALKSDRRPKTQRLAELRTLDPAAAVLDLKVLDPAMGSGHFLVTAVDFLSDYIAELVEYVPAVPEWLGGGKGEKDEAYVSPLVERVAAIRAAIIQRAQAADWVLDEAQLSDQAIIRRMVLKRCIYGVDKNPLTVELAKVSLWLHSFTVGAPLSFLDHHLRCGDSLIGLRVLEAREELRRLGGLSASSAIAGAESAASGMQRIEELSDADVAEVRESADLFRGVEGTTADLRGLLDILCGLRWLSAGMKKRDRAAFEAPLAEALDRQPAKAYALLAQGREAADPAADSQAFGERWDAARSIADRERFLHWEAAFPGVWQGWQDDRPQGGFDAVIGNPPWDQIEQPEVEWFAARDDEIARAETGAKRKALIKQRVAAGDELAMEYEAVRNAATAMRMYARTSGNYPLLSGGRINLYSLFVERALRLINPNGLVGLLTPSGIYADKTAARFFQSLSTSGRIAGLFDFENRKIFFKDVHASFKFCALVFGGEGRRFDQTECAFFLHDTATIRDSERCFPLAPADFARVNPNTGTAPVFRTRRDAEITGRIYERHPVLVDRSGGTAQKAWPVQFKQGLFNMTSDSHLFRTAAQLEAEGYYPVQGNRWKKGEETYLPLYQGRMIHQFDHRANSVRVNPQSTHNPYLSEEVGEEQHRDPGFLPQSQYWVPAQAIEASFPQGHGYSLGFRDIARATDVRTMISSALPMVGCGHTLPVFLPSENHFPSENAGCLLANFNSFGFDYVARQKVQGTHLTWYTIEQLPVIASEDYERPFGAVSARDLVRDHVLRLTYTAHDMAPFARDLGHDGPPFPWDEEDRRHLRARLDACYFHLYGLGREDADYVLGTFPIVRREDEARFGSYRTRDLILAYMNALAAGDTETVVAV